MQGSDIQDRLIYALFRAVGCDDPEQASIEQHEEVVRIIVSAAVKSGIDIEELTARYQQSMQRRTKH